MASNRALISIACGHCDSPAQLEQGPVAVEIAAQQKVRRQPSSRGGGNVETSKTVPNRDVIITCLSWGPILALALTTRRPARP
jgi:hypothetical protein